MFLVIQYTLLIIKGHCCKKTNFQTYLITCTKIKLSRAPSAFLNAFKFEVLGSVSLILGPSASVLRCSMYLFWRDFSHYKKKIEEGKVYQKREGINKSVKIWKNFVVRLITSLHKQIFWKMMYYLLLIMYNKCIFYPKIFIKCLSK